MKRTMRRSRVVWSLCLLSVFLVFLLNYRASTTPFLEPIQRPFDIWLFDAYLIEDTKIRVTLITWCKYFANLTLYIEGEPAVPFDLELLEECPSNYIPRCLYNGYFGDVINVSAASVSKVLERKKKMYVGYEDDPIDRWKAMPLIDSRAPPLRPKKHRLGVCVFPIVQFAHWGALVQFFEMWIGHGATKFFIVYQSMSKECDAMSRIYENDPSIEIERVHWGELQSPHPNASLEDDPNGFVMRGEQVFAASECLLRARGSVEYVASVDLDEIFVVYKNATLVELLDSLLKQQPNVGAFVFRSSYGVFNNVWQDATHPSQLNFDIFNDIYLENRTLEAGSMSKMIVKPERVKAISVHYALSFEKERFFSYDVDIQRAKIFHLRLVKWMYATANISSSDGSLERYTPRWTEHYKTLLANEVNRLQRIPKIDFLSLKDKVWANNGMKVMEELESCFLALLRRGRESCPAHYKCYANLTAIKRNEWVYAKQKWIVLK